MCVCVCLCMCECVCELYIFMLIILNGSNVIYVDQLVVFFVICFRLSFSDMNFLGLYLMVVSWSPSMDL